MANFIMVSPMGQFDDVAVLARRSSRVRLARRELGQHQRGAWLGATGSAAGPAKAMAILAADADAHQCTDLGEFDRDGAAGGVGEDGVS